jgi:hypothetical protein
MVEDVVKKSAKGPLISLGTKVSDDVLAVDPDTLFPLQGALGYDITQTLFVGKHTLLVEGPSDILYLQSLSAALKRRGRTGLDGRWTMCPSGGIDKIQAFVSLFKGNALDVAVLTDQGIGDKAKIARLRASKILEAGRVFSIAELLGKTEADIEDIFEPEVLVGIVNQACKVPGSHVVDVATVMQADPGTTRLVKKIEAVMRTMPPIVVEFDHYLPAEWLLINGAVLDVQSAAVDASLTRAERIFVVLNAAL